MVGKWKNWLNDYCVHENRMNPFMCTPEPGPEFYGELAALTLQAFDLE